jgi:hypothetical protein
MIEEPSRSSCLRIYKENSSIFEKAQWSSTKHQAWDGWYLDHITDIMNIAVGLYNNLSYHRPLWFSLSDCLLILFLHDLEKPWKYAWTDEQKQEVKNYPDYKDFVLSKIDEYGFILNDEQMNWLKYVHWEWNDYNPLTRIQGPLSAFVHICDTISARIWFDFPKNKDNW